MKLCFGNKREKKNVLTTPLFVCMCKNPLPPPPSYPSNTYTRTDQTGLSAGDDFFRCVSNAISLFFRSPRMCMSVNTVGSKGWYSTYTYVQPLFFCSSSSSTFQFSTEKSNRTNPQFYSAARPTIKCHRQPNAILMQPLVRLHPSTLNNAETRSF